MDNKAVTGYRFLPQLFLRAPHYSFGGYDLSRMPEVLQQSDFMNALWLASPEFYRILQAKEFAYDQLLPKEINTLQKYYNRICYRSTPFGSFASFTMLRWADDTPVRLRTAEQAFIHLRPDQQLLNTVNSFQRSNFEPEKVALNPTLYPFGRFFRYTKTTQSEKSGYIFSVEALAAGSFNAGLIALFKKGTLSVEQVLKYIRKKGACTANEALDHLHFLLDAQVLISPFTGSIIGTNGQTPYGDKPEGWAAFWGAKHRLPSVTSTPIADAARELDRLLENVLPPNLPQPFYAALEKPWASGGPGPEEQQILTETMSVLHRLAIQRQPEDLVQFIQAFQKRFDRERVPILVALDPEIGIPYGNLQAQETNMKPLENIGFPNTAGQKQQLGWTPIHRLLIRLWTGDASREYWSPLLINKEDLAELPDTADGDDLPQTLALMYRPAGEHLIIDHADGVAATSLIGRFSLFSNEVHDFCKNLAELETIANQDVVFADIGQRSDSHVDNINRRAAIYPYEIPLNVFSVQPQTAQIRPEDLLLYVSGGQLILESASLSKRVIPRLASAYNFRNNNLPIFRLLCDLQYQGLQASLSFDLESLFPGLQFYPRVAYGHAVLSLAKWKFKATEVKHLLDASDKDAIPLLKTFRSAHHLPRHISLGSYDQQLVFDIAQVAEARFFLACIKGLKHMVIQEYLMPARSVLSGNKPLAGQLVAFLSHQKNIYRGLDVTAGPFREVTERSFLLGSDWLYLKIYCTPRIADLLLAKVIQPFIRNYKMKIKKWFFIRYEENGYHLRLRVQADPTNLGDLLVILREKLVAGGYHKLIKSYQGDTYQREIERYGLSDLPHIETIFCAGSNLVVSFLTTETKADWEEVELALVTTDGMISSLLDTDQGRVEFLKRICNSFLLEFKGDKTLTAAMDKKYRELRPLFNNLSQSRFRSGRWKTFMTQIKKLAARLDGYTEQQRTSLVADLLHMQMNRTFAVQQRRQEFLVYYCLQKEILSRIARKS